VLCVGCSLRNSALRGRSSLIWFARVIEGAQVLRLKGLGRGGDAG